MLTKVKPQAADDVRIEHPHLIEKIEELGFGWRLVPQFDITALDMDHGVQVRGEEHWAPRANVDKYAVQMGETANFPPIILTQDNAIVDGRTRIAARRKRKDKFTPAIIIDVEFDTASEKRRRELVVLGASLNQANGLPLTTKEMRKAVVEALKLGFKTETIQRMIGARSGIITQVRREANARDKLTKVGLDPDDIRVALRGLGMETALSLNDEPYKELALLASDAGFSITEISQLCKELKELGSDKAALNRLAEVRTENEERIRDHHLTGSGRPPAARILRQRLGYVVNHADKPQNLVELNVAAADQHIETLEASIRVLEAVLDLQNERKKEMDQ